MPKITANSAIKAAARAAAGLFLGLALVAWRPPAALAQPPLWVVRSHGATVFLFGSIHLLPAGLDWRSPALEDALAAANELWFELPLTAASDNAAAAAFEKQGRLPHGVSLIALMSPDHASELRRVAAELHCSIETLERMRPWLAEVTISLAADARSGANAFNGVEDQIQAVTPLSVRRRAFETAEQQVAFLAGAAPSDQLASLDWTLRQIEDDPASYGRIVDEWMAGDIGGLERDATLALKGVSPALYERLITNRNRRWAKLLHRWLRRPGVIVVVVGVGHLIGPDGLPALLRAQGLDVEGP